MKQQFSQRRELNTPGQAHLLFFLHKNMRFSAVAVEKLKFCNSLYK
jgi:hypothetical protein